MAKFKIDISDIKELMASADTNGDGQIDYNEFCFLLRSKDAESGKSKGLKKTISKY